LMWRAGFGAQQLRRAGHAARGCTGRSSRAVTRNEAGRRRGWWLFEAAALETVGACAAAVALGLRAAAQRPSSAARAARGPHLRRWTCGRDRRGTRCATATRSGGGASAAGGHRCRASWRVRAWRRRACRRWAWRRRYAAASGYRSSTDTLEAAALQHRAGRPPLDPLERVASLHSVWPLADGLSGAYANGKVQVASLHHVSGPLRPGRQGYKAIQANRGDACSNEPISQCTARINFCNTKQNV
jgi:hypothetical protein